MTSYKSEKVLYISQKIEELKLIMSCRLIKLLFFFPLENKLKNKNNFVLKNQKYLFYLLSWANHNLRGAKLRKE